MNYKSFAGRKKSSGDRDPKIEEGNHTLKLLSYKIEDKEKIAGVRPAITEFMATFEVVDSDTMKVGSKCVYRVDDRNGRYDENVADFIIECVAISTESESSDIELTEAMVSELFDKQELVDTVIACRAVAKKTKAGHDFLACNFRAP